RLLGEELSERGVRAVIQRHHAHVVVVDRQRGLVERLHPPAERGLHVARDLDGLGDWLGTITQADADEPAELQGVWRQSLRRAHERSLADPMANGGLLV